MVYKSINRLSKEIQTAIKRLESGELSVLEMNTLIGNVQSLEERLYILRYKIQEQKSKSTNATKKEKRAQAEIPVLFKVEPIEPNPVATNQTSLIDIIEEIEDEKKPAEIQSALFNLEEIPSEKTVAVEKLPAEKKAKKSPLEKREKKTRSTSSKTRKTSDGKNETLVNKMKSAPISDLKKSINLNLKFRFIKALYNNDNDAYNASIEKLNKTQNMAEAKQILAEIKKTNHWEAEIEEEELLLELLERKHEK